MDKNNIKVLRLDKDDKDILELEDIGEIKDSKIEESKTSSSPSEISKKFKNLNESPKNAKQFCLNSCNSPNLLDKPSFFNNILSNGNSNRNFQNNVVGTNNTITNRKSINITEDTRTKAKSPKLDPRDLNMKNNLNNIFSAFSNSSVINSLNPGFKQNVQSSNDRIGNSPGLNRRKMEITNNVSNPKERKASPLKFNALFNSALVSSNPNQNSNPKNNNPNNFNGVQNHNINTIISNVSNLNNQINPKKDESSQANNIVISPLTPLSSNIHHNSQIPESSANCYSVKEYSYKEDKNLRFRNSMEDFGKIIDMYMNDKTKGFFSLYDGHGGTDPVKYAKDRMPDILSKMIEKYDNIEQSLINAFHKVDDELKFTDSENTGCTASVILICMENSKKFVYSANVGDSKSILISTDEVIKLSYDHKCSDSQEVERIRETGGIVFNGRVFGQLVLTRALGDHALKIYGVISTPFITKIQIESKHKYIILASDGVWDVISDEDALKMSGTINSADEFAKLLIRTAVNNGSKDNISCIVIKLN